MSFAQEASQVWNQLLADVKQKLAENHHQQGVLDSFRAFSAAVDWREPWLVAVLSLQTLLFFSVLVMRKSNTFLTAVFVFAMLTVYSSEQLNRLLSQNWQTFAGQPYFDKNGIFISAILSAPLVLDMLVILICYLLNLGTMLVQMKRQELRHKARQRAKVAQQPDSKKTS